MERLSWQPQLKRRRSAILSRCAIFLLGGLAVASAAAAGFSASLDRETVLLGESVTLTFKFEGVRAGGMPQIPPIAGLRAVGGASSGFSSSTGPDGKTQTVQTYAVPFVTERAGEVTIPAFNIEMGGQKFSSVPLKLKVLKEDPGAPPADYATNQVFLWLILPRQEAYVGEVLTPEVRLYLREEIAQIDQLNIPAASGGGYIAGQPHRTSQFRRRVGNANYNVIAMNFTLTPVKSGNHPIQFNEGRTVVFGGPQDVFGRYRQSAQVTFASQPEVLQVLPVPAENRPGSFNGAVGNYNLNVSVGPTNVATGDPITVRVQISGRGALDAVTLPEQTGWGEFKAYPPTAQVEYSDPLGVQGTKTFEQVVSPESVDIKELPPFVFSFFDPETKTFRTLTHPATKLTVRPGGVVVAPTIAAAAPANANEAARQVDIVPIKQRLDQVSWNTAPLLTRPAFLATQAVPVLAFFMALVWRKRSDSLARNPRLRRQRQVEQLVREGLAKLRTLAAQNQSDAFFAELIRLLRERLGERLDCPASAITEAVIDEKLRPRGIPDTTLEELRELFQLYNQARYAPVRTTQELNAVLAKLESALRKLAEVRT